MATLKMTCTDNNHVWLTNVKRIEEMGRFYPTKATAGKYPAKTTAENLVEACSAWQFIQDQLAALKEKNPVLHSIIELHLETYDSHCTQTKLTEEPLLLLYVVLDVGDDVQAQNWLVVADKNYLLENGKTVDRI